MVQPLGPKTPSGPQTSMPTEIVARVPRLRFSQRHPRLFKALGALASGAGLAIFDRICWMPEGITAAKESLFIMTLIGMGFGWVIAAISGRGAKKVAERDAEIAGLHKDNLELRAQLKTQYAEFKPGGEVYVRGRKRYEIIKLLGEGGFGKVWLVRNKRVGMNNREEVMKIGHKHLFEDKENARRFARECRNQISVDHINVARVHLFYGREENVTEEEQELLNGQSGFTMEYIKGLPLSERIGLGHGFQENEFQDGAEALNRLCKAIEADGYGFSLATYKGKEESYTIERLNELLEMPNLYDIWKEKRGKSVNIPPDIQKQIDSAAERTEGYRSLRKEDYSMLSGMADKEAQKIPRWVNFLNRLLIEATYPELCPKSGPLKPRDAVEVVLQTLAGLEAAHKKGLIHRDIKPQNIMVLNEGPKIHIKILDFGLSKSEDDPEKTRGAMVEGSIFYMAPEQHKQGSPTAQTDFYALGVMLHELLYGDVPYGRYREAIKEWQGKGSPNLGKDKAGLIIKNPLQKFQDEVTKGAIPKIKEEIVPEKHRQLLGRIFTGLLRKEQEFRYGTHAELRKDLEALKAVFGPEEESAKPSAPEAGPAEEEASPIQQLKKRLAANKVSGGPEPGPGTPDVTLRGIGKVIPEKEEAPKADRVQILPLPERGEQRDKASIAGEIGADKKGPAEPEHTLPGIAPALSDQNTIILGPKDDDDKNGQ